MKTKMLEVRDRATYIAVMAVLLKGDNFPQRKLLNAAGFGSNGLVLVSRLDGVGAKYNSYDWGDRTISVAHRYIEEHFHLLNDGDVVDVEFILGETSAKKEPQ